MLEVVIELEKKLLVKVNIATRLGMPMSVVPNIILLLK